MGNFIKIFHESGTGGERRLEDAINEFIAEQDVDIVDVKVIFRKGAFEDTMFIVVVFKRKATIADIKDVRLIVKEGVPSLVIENPLSTVGIKVRYNDEWLGDYRNFDKPTLEVREVVDAANTLFGKLIESLKEGGTSR